MPSPSNLNLMLVGCGHMGQSMLNGWITSGIFSNCHIVDPSYVAPPDIDNITVHRSTETLPEKIDIIVFAVKPQIMNRILPEYDHLMKTALGISVAAGTPLSLFENSLGTDIRMIRAMPNTPAAIGKGVTALYGNKNVKESDRSIAQTLMQPLGPVVWCDDEDSLNDVTALSGSGPAYVFYMIEALAKAGENLGLDKGLAQKLARQTVIGAASLAESSEDTSASDLRKNVTSPNGTTAAGLDVLMNENSGLSPLMEEVLKAAAKRARELANE